MLVSWFGDIKLRKTGYVYPKYSYRYVEEGRARGNACVGEIWYDDFIIGILAEEYETLAR